MTQWAAVITNRSAISAPPQKNNPSIAMATCHVCSPTIESSPPTILRLLWPLPRSSRNSRRRITSRPVAVQWSRPLDGAGWPPHHFTTSFPPPPPPPPTTVERFLSLCCRPFDLLPSPLAFTQRPEPDDGVKCGGVSLPKLSSCGEPTDDRPQSGDSVMWTTLGTWN